VPAVTYLIIILDNLAILLQILLLPLNVEIARLLRFMTSNRVE